MRASRCFALMVAVSALTCIAAAPPAARVADAWQKAAPQTGKFTVETPCTAEQVVRFRQAPDSVVPGVKIAPEARVLCMKGKVLLLAGEFVAPDMPAGSVSLFDMVMTEGAKDPTAEGHPTQGVHDGRRTFTNRQESGGFLAQTGFVEVGRDKLIMLVAGVQPDSGLSVDEQSATIDRFYASIKVTG